MTAITYAAAIALVLPTAAAIQTAEDHPATLARDLAAALGLAVCVAPSDGIRLAIGAALALARAAVALSTAWLESEDAADDLAAAADDATMAAVAALGLIPPIA